MTNHEIIDLGSCDMMRLTRVMMGCTPRVYWNGRSHQRIPIIDGVAWPTRVSYSRVLFMLSAYAVLN